MAEAGRSGNVTIADVARHANVATSTVSYVLSGKRSISFATRRRVEQSIKDLNFYPNAGARSLAGHRTDTVALAIPFRPEHYVPVMMEIATSIATLARQKFGQDVLLVTSKEGAEGIHRIAIGNRADGVMLMDVATDDERLPALRSLEIPAVLIGMPADAGGIACVDLDFTAAGELCVEHLAERGHRTVAFIGESEEVYERHNSSAVRTLQGVTAGADRLSVRLTARPCAGTHEAASALIRQILEESPETTALIVKNDQALPSLLHVLRSARRLVPEDISVIAICSDQDAVRTTPMLTSVTIPAEEMGVRAISLLNALIRGEGTPEQVLLPPTLVLRGSTSVVASRAAGDHSQLTREPVVSAGGRKTTTKPTAAKVPA